MRGNPIVELIAILVMLASVLVGGAYWGVYKQEKKGEKEKWVEEFKRDVKDKQEKANLSFEKAVKATQ